MTAAHPATEATPDAESAAAEEINTGRAALEEAIERYKSPALQEFELNQRKAKALASSHLVPTTYQNNAADCLIALDLAERTNMAPLMVMQNLDIIHGRPSWRSQFIIGCVNNSGRFTPMQFAVSGSGDAKQCVAWAIDKETGARVESPPVSIAMAKAEGWHDRKGSKWQTLPDLMLRYRSAAFFGRLYVPELLMGFPAEDESRDIGAAGAQSGQARTSVDDILKGGAEVTAGAEASGVATVKPEPPPQPLQEIDPETGEVIPDHVGRAPEQGQLA